MDIMCKQLKVWLLIFFLPFSQLSYSASKTKEETLLAQVNFKEISVTKETLLQFEQIISEALNQKIRIIQDKNNHLTNRYDILITDSKHASLLQHNWLLSPYSLGKVPGFSLISKNKTLNKSDIITKVNRPFNTLMYPRSYQSDNFTSATRLLSINKAAAIIDYNINVGRYSMFDKTLTISQLSDEKDIFIKFTSPKLLGTFNQKAQTELNLLDDETLPSKTQLKWLVIAKTFDQQSQKLVPFDNEVRVSKLLSKKLTEHNIEIITANTSSAFNMIKNATDVCVFNIFKSPKREKIALFSSPTNLYLDMRLFTLKNSKADIDIRNYLIDGEINLKAYFSQLSSSLIGIYNFTGTKRAAQWLDFFRDLEHKIINFNSVEEVKSFHLLSMGRVEYIFNYETFFNNNLPEDMDINDFSSYSIESNNRVNYSYLACSQSALGQKVISAVNYLLNDLDTQTEISDIYTADMTKQGKEAFHNAFVK